MFKKGIIGTRGMIAGRPKKRYVDHGTVKRVGKDNVVSSPKIAVTECETTVEEDARFIAEQMKDIQEAPLVPEPSWVSKTVEILMHSDTQITEVCEEAEPEPEVEEPLPEVEEPSIQVESGHLVVIDFEATCFKSQRVLKEETEIIEFAAVLVDKATLTPVAEFSSFVRPVIYPVLDNFCLELTNITQDMVDNAPSFPTVLKMFTRWLEQFPSEKIFCSWGEYDRNQLTMECERNNVAFPFSSDHWNLKKMFSKAKGTKKGFGVGAALKNVGLQFEGTQHRGIDDARNIVRLLPHCTTEPF